MYTFLGVRVRINMQLWQIQACIFGNVFTINFLVRVNQPISRKALTVDHLQCWSSYMGMVYELAWLDCVFCNWFRSWVMFFLWWMMSLYMSWRLCHRVIFNICLINPNNKSWGGSHVKWFLHVRVMSNCSTYMLYSLSCFYIMHHVPNAIYMSMYPRSQCVILYYDCIYNAR